MDGRANLCHAARWNMPGNRRSDWHGQLINYVLRVPSQYIAIMDNIDTATGINDIYYNTLGFWYLPEPEVMEKLYLEHHAEKQKKTA